MNYKINPNAFAGTFAFLPSHKPTQKNQKSLQANAQGQCKLDTTHHRPKRSPAGNSTYKKLAVQCSADRFVVAESFVLRINICGKNRQLLVAANRYWQVVRDSKVKAEN
jgi:hypothetical protein